MSVLDSCLIRFRGSAGEWVVRLGMPLADGYLEFLAGRCRPNTVLAAAYDLRVFFGVVAKQPHEVVATDVLGFITAQRTGHDSARLVRSVDADAGSGGVATSTVARRLSTISGFFAYLLARGDVAANPVPRGLPTRRERLRPGQGVPLTRRSRRLPRVLTWLRSTCSPPRCARTGTGRWWPRWCWAVCAAAKCSGCGWTTCGWPNAGCLSPTARAGINDWSRSRRGSSQRPRPTLSSSAHRTPRPITCSWC